jgi:hypothetical protein
MKQAQETARFACGRDSLRQLLKNRRLTRCFEDASLRVIDIHRAPVWQVWSPGSCFKTLHCGSLIFTEGPGYVAKTLTLFQNPSLRVIDIH